MAKNKVEVDVRVDDKGTTKKTAFEAKKLGKELDKTTKAAGTADRNIKGTAQASANATKNFSKMSQGMGGLVGVYATLAAQVFAVSAAFQFLRSASETTNLIKGQEALGGATGVAYKTITNSLKEATDGQLQYAEAARAAAIGVSSGLNPEQLERLATAAKNVSFALGRDLTDSFNRLVRGVTKAEPELLDELGITLRLKDATEEYANAINKKADDLTQFEKSQAIVNNVLDQAEQKFAAIEKIMDPSAAALNNFLASFDSLINSLKIGITETLTPIFAFLSEQTLALTASLGLFALPILKLILPSFDDWKKAAEDSIGRQQEVLDGLNKKYEETRLNLKNLGKDQTQALKDNAKASKDVFKSLKIDTSGATETGRKGVDFLAGGATSRAAEANAEKILKNAEKQLKDSLEVRSGYLKGANKQQVADLRASYEQRKRILQNFEKQHGNTWKKAELQVSSYTTKARIQLSRLQKTTARVSKAINKSLSTAFRVAGFIGIALLIFDLGKAAYEFFFPISKEAEKAQEAVESFTEKSKTLNEELDRMSQVRADITLQGLQERVIALGNAFNSANLVQRFREFDALDPNTEGYKEARLEIETTLEVLSKMSPEFAKATKSLDFNNLSESGAELFNIANGFAEVATAAQKLPETLQGITLELTRLAGSGKAIDPTVNLRAGLTQGVEQSKTLVSGLRNEIQQLEGFSSAETDKLRGELETLQGRDANTFGTGTTSSNIAQKEAAVAKKRAELLSSELKDREATTKALKAAEKELEAAVKQQEYLNALSIEFEKISGKLIERQNKINTLKIEQAKNQTLGITIEDKLKNLQNDRVSLTVKELEAANKVEAARAASRAAEKSGSEEQKKAAAASEQAALTQQDITLAQNALEERRLKLEEQKLNFQKELNTLKRQELLAQESLNEELIKQQRISKGLTASFGVAQAREADKALGDVLTKRLETARKQQAQAASEYTEILGRSIGPNATATEQDVLNARSSFEASNRTLKNLLLDVEAYSRRNEIFVNGVRAQTEELRLRQQSLSLNPAEQKYNELINEAKLKGLKLTEKEKEKLREQAQAQVELNAQIEAQEGLYNSIESNMTSAFSSVIQGTMTVKDAFKNMAVSILQDIANIIAKQLVLKAIMGGLGGLFGGGATGADSLQSTTGFSGTGEWASLTGNLTGRYGGVFSNGSKMPGYAVGGIAKGPNAGYPAMLHGTEAVVPLPNNRSIPVDLKGAGQQNNVTVNVAIDNEGNASQTSQADSSQGENIGKLVAFAVQKELQNQKRSGGILNPYGVA